MLKCSHIYYCEVFTILFISSLFTGALENQFKANYYFFLYSLSTVALESAFLAECGACACYLCGGAAAA